MITYDSLLKQRNTLEKLQELYAKQYQIAVNKHALGMATDQDVLTAQTNQLSGGKLRGIFRRRTAEVKAYVMHSDRMGGGCFPGACSDPGDRSDSDRSDESGGRYEEGNRQ